MINRVLFLLTLCVIAFTCSGCATILGGIIGYQSGEMVAGMAIGAALDFGDDIARGVGQMTANEKNLQRDFQQKSTFNAQKGEIDIPINPFNRQRVETMTAKLNDKIQQNNWTCQRIEKTVKKPWIGPTCWKETWQCATAAEPPQAFELKIQFHSNRNTKIRIKPAECNTEQTTAITSQIYEWLEQSVP